ncbi:esterase family protein [Talaromyces pinophilus]|uniref:Esterase family protein n=1 Tax=Talaromyces pinophilus TaxID=128442 RepID=A0A6V8HEL6_TALPI|nr:esterase family protein [Talaromyces pinophilus]
MRLLTFSLFTAPLLAHPTVNADENAHLQERAPTFEWTAWGDSYASGVGSGSYTYGRRCLRYDQAYPVLIEYDPDNLLSGSGGTFNNVVCSGAKAEEVEEYQFYTEGQDSGQPSWQFYPRPSSGKPTMGTLSVGGDDIDFPGILNNCIMDGFPWPLSSGFTQRTCDEQRDLSWSLICQDGDKNTPSNDLISKIDSVIKKIVQYGQSASGSNFRLYVTGYGRFFNDQDTGCDTVTFARTANPNSDGQQHTLLTTGLRSDFNAMSLTLNAAIQQAVNQNSGSNVKYIDIDGLMGTGHRFCEPGIQEPDQNNPNLWFWHYPYNQNDDSTNPTIAYLNSVGRDNINTLAWNQSSTLWTDYVADFWTKVDYDQLNRTVGDNVTAQLDIWPDVIGYRAKVFHPQVAFHQAIYKAIVTQYISDTTPSYAKGTCCFHLDEWENCNPESDDLYANITLLDNLKNVIYQTPGSDFQNGDLGDPINVGNGTTVQGPLPYSLAITGEHEHDYIQFTYGSLSWQSKEPNGGAQCTVGGWNPRDGPECEITDYAAAENQMDCCFPC